MLYMVYHWFEIHVHKGVSGQNVDGQNVDNFGNIGQNVDGQNADSKKKKQS